MNEHDKHLKLTREVDSRKNRSISHDRKSQFQSDCLLTRR